MITEYEQNPEALDDNEEYDYSKEKRRSHKREKRKVYTMTRSPGDCMPIRVPDDIHPDEAITKYIADGHDEWMNRNQPERVAKIRKQLTESINQQVKLKKGKRR